MPANQKPKGVGAQRRSVERKAKPQFGSDGTGEKEKPSMAFVIVQHLGPHHASRLSNLLGKVTAMPVSEIAGTTTPKPNTVYVQPPNKCVIAKDGALTSIHRFRRFAQICYATRS